MINVNPFVKVTQDSSVDGLTALPTLGGPYIYDFATTRLINPKVNVVLATDDRKHNVVMIRYNDPCNYFHIKDGGIELGLNCAVEEDVVTIGTDVVNILKSQKNYIDGLVEIKRKYPDFYEYGNYSVRNEVDLRQMIDEYSGEFTLEGQDGNAHNLVGYTAHALRRAGIPRAIINEFESYAFSSDYDNLIQECMRYLDKANYCYATKQVYQEYEK